MEQTWGRVGLHDCTMVGSLLHIALYMLKDLTSWHMWQVYHEKVQTSQIWLRDCTMVGVLPLLLFGGEVSRQPAAGTVAIDGWLVLDCPPKLAVLLAELRSHLDRLLQVRLLGYPTLACIVFRPAGQLMHHSL